MVVAALAIAVTGVGLGLSVWAAPAVSARVWVEPEDQQVQAGETFTVTLMVEGAVDLAGYEFDLGYDPALFEGLDAEDGGFLDDEGRTVSPIPPQIDNEAGLLSFAAFSTGTTEAGVDGTGPLAVITMKALAQVQTSALKPQDVHLFNTDGEEYEHVAIGDWRIYLPILLRRYGP